MVRLLKSVYWDQKDATFSIFCDVCPEGMGFWYLVMKLGFYSPTPDYERPDLIIYFEALCVLSALLNAHCCMNQHCWRQVVFPPEKPIKRHVL